MPITINGDALLITLPAATPSIDVEADLYSEWKKWTLLADNLRYEEAFTTEGGSPTIPGEVSGKNFFLRNDLGWRIRPAEEDAEVNFIGNLFRTDAALPLIIPTLGAFTVLITGVQSSLSFVKETGVSGLTAGESTALTQARDYALEARKLLRNKRVLDTMTGIETIYDDNGDVLFTRNVYIDKDAAVPYDGTQAPHRVERYS